MSAECQQAEFVTATNPKVRKIQERMAALAAQAADPDLRSMILDPDLRSLKDLRSDLRSRPVNPNPDGLDHKIWGRHADVIKTDPAFLMARQWGVHPIDLRTAIDRRSVEWVQKQVAFVAAKPDHFFRKTRADYLAHLILKSAY